MLLEHRGARIVCNDDVRLFPTQVFASRLVFTPEQDGVYRLVITSQTGKVGKYSLQATEVVPEGPPLEFRGELVKNDKNNDGNFFHWRQIDMVGGRPYVIVLASEDFDTSVGLMHGTENKFVSFWEKMDHGNPRLTRLHVTPATSGPYRVYVTTLRRQQIGAYHVTVQGYSPKK